MTRPTPPEPETARPHGRLARWLPAPGPVGPAAAPGSREGRAWRLVSVLTLALVVLSGAVVAGALLVQREATQQKTYFESVGRLDLDSAAAQVTVRSGGTDRVVVFERVGWALRRPTVTERIDGGTMAISVGCPEPRALGCAVALEIQVPPTTVIHARNGSGRTEIMDLAGGVSAETGSGQVQLTRVSGPIWAKSGSGQIIGTGLGSSTAQLFSSSGQVTLQYARPPESVTARLASGNLVLRLPDDHSQYRLEINSADGHQEIDPSLQNSGSPRLLDLALASGSVTVDRGPGS